jgi:ATP-dependent Clp protease ATP-binding subunit ClpB
VLDDGRLTDGQGRTVDFRNTVIIMTSNLGSNLIQEMAAEGDYDAMKGAVMEVVGQHFRPEFINRLDESVVFHPLDESEIRQIASLQVDVLAKRLEEQDITFKVSDAALDFLGEVGFDPVFGARPLKRAIQIELENPLSQKLLAAEFLPGDEIDTDLVDGKIVFTKG